MTEENQHKNDKVSNESMKQQKKKKMAKIKCLTYWKKKAI